MKNANMIGVRAALWLAAANLVVPFGASAGWVNRPTWGGDNGTAFRLDCGNDKVLVGIQGNKEAWIYQVAPLCVPLDVDAKWVGKPGGIGLMMGINNGQPYTRKCPENTVVRALDGRYGWYVNEIELRCRPLGAASPEYRIKASGSSSGDHGAPIRWCADGEPARGLRGKFGNYIDRIGLICHTGATPRAQRPPNGRAAVNLVGSGGSVSARPTGVVELRWTDRSTVESSFVVKIWNVASGLESQLSAPGADGRGSVRRLTKVDLPNGSYRFNVCAQVNGVELCPEGQWPAFEILRLPPGTDSD